MSEIRDLEGRITAALDRIRAGVAARQAAPVVTPQDADTSDLRAQLDDERTAKTALEDRVAALKARQDATITGLENRAQGHAAQLATLEAELQRLRASNAQLRDVTAQLRSAAAEGATAPELINRAALAELEALSAQRASEASEMDAIVTSLKPLIEET